MKSLSKGPSEPAAALPASVVEHIPYLRRYARALTHDAADADDLVQNALERALSKADLFEVGTNLRAWLMSIMHNTFIDEFRKKRRTREVRESNDTFSDGAHSPANQLHLLQLNDLNHALARLPIAQRSTLLLVSLEGMNYADVAKVTGVPLGTVRSRLSRARHSLLQMMHGKYLNEEKARLSSPQLLAPQGTDDSRR